MAWICTIAYHQLLQCSPTAAMPLKSQEQMDTTPDYQVRHTGWQNLGTAWLQLAYSLLHRNGSQRRTTCMGSCTSRQMGGVNIKASWPDRINRKWNDGVLMYASGHDQQ